MAYSDFKTFDILNSKFPITISSDSLFADISRVEQSAFLVETLAENIPLALSISTEKARSELMVMPILVEVRKQLNRQISLFSGVEFTVDTSMGLSGYCDYILSRSSIQIFIDAPVVCMVEAKNLDLSKAYPQCIAEMIAAQRFNAEKSNEIETIWGAVTTGSNWRFIRLIGYDVTIDFDEYLISQIDKILGIFQHILET
ncbi:MAG: hypothetical protein AAF639_25290 [Chloroflexota bacterium]